MSGLKHDWITLLTHICGPRWRSALHKRRFNNPPLHRERLDLRREEIYYYDQVWTQHPTPCWRLFLNYNTRFEENFYIRGPHLRKHFFRPISTVSIVVCGTGGKRNRNPIVEITSFRPRFPRKLPLQSSKNNHHKLEQRTACSYSSPYLHRNSTKFHGYFGSSVNSSNNCLRSGWISAAKPHWLALPPCL